MKKQIVLLLALIMLVFSGCRNDVQIDAGKVQSSAPVIEEIAANDSLGMLTFTLPNGITERKNSDSQRTFLKNAFDAGGVFLLKCESKIFDDVQSYQDTLTNLVHSAMKDLGFSEWEWSMSNSSMYGLLEFHMGNAESEYVAYFIRGNSACYVFWFDRNLISANEETIIMDSLHSEDITDELNMVSTQALADAIAESMAQKEYMLEVILPDGIVEKDQTEDGALFYQNGNLVGGYKTVHFEKGILPAVHENQNMILEHLKECLIDQIDLTEYSGEIIDEVFITARFSNGDTEYTHYILTYGQVGTQYDIWFNEKLLDSSTVTGIISKVELVNTQNGAIE